MESIILLLATRLAYKLSYTQGFQTYMIGGSGCTINLLANPGAFRKNITKRGDTMYRGECKVKDSSFGFITIELKNPYRTGLEAEAVLARFMQNITPTFFIRHTAGLHFGYDQASNIDVCGISDYWQDFYDRDWKVKGWTNGKILSLLYVSNIGNLSTEQQEGFLDSFRFPVEI